MGIEHSVMDVIAERDAANERFELLRKDLSCAIGVFQNWIETLNRRIEDLRGRLKKAESRALPEACDTKLIIDSLTDELSRVNTRRAELEETQAKMDSTLHGLTVQLDTLKADYERVTGENVQLREEVRKLETTLGLLE